MFAILDANHHAALVVEGRICEQLRQRAIDLQEDLFTSVVTMQEMIQGWLANSGGSRGVSPTAKPASEHGHDECEIAAISLSHDALLLARNLRDF